MTIRLLRRVVVLVFGLFALVAFTQGPVLASGHEPPSRAASPRTVAAPSATARRRKKVLTPRRGGTNMGLRIIDWLGAAAGPPGL